MEKQITIKDVIVKFLKTTRRKYINEGILESECIKLGQKLGVYHCGSSYSRVFRDIREPLDRNDPSDESYRVGDIVLENAASHRGCLNFKAHKTFKYKTWSIERCGRIV